MSALGHERRFCDVCFMSVVPTTTDIRLIVRDGRKVPLTTKLHCSNLDYYSIISSPATCKVWGNFQTERFSSFEVDVASKYAGGNSGTFRSFASLLMRLGK